MYGAYPMEHLAETIVAKGRCFDQIVSTQLLQDSGFFLKWLWSWLCDNLASFCPFCGRWKPWQFRINAYMIKQGSLLAPPHVRCLMLCYILWDGSFRTFDAQIPRCRRGAVMMPDLRYIKIPNRFNAALPVSITTGKKNKKNDIGNSTTHTHIHNQKQMALFEIGVQYTWTYKHSAVKKMYWETHDKLMLVK